LQGQGADFSSVNVLDYPSIRDGVKKFSEWPTIPQLYVNGEFIGVVIWLGTFPWFVRSAGCIICLADLFIVCLWGPLCVVLPP